MNKAGDELIAQLYERLTQSLEVAVSAFASELDVVPPVALRGAAAKGKPARGPEPSPEHYAGRGSCGACGQPGVKKKTCGKTPNHPGTYSGRQTPTKPEKDSKAKDADDDEGAAIRHVANLPTPPVQVRVVAPQPRPASSPPPRPAPPRPPTALTIALSALIPPAPKKTVKRDRALQEIRDEQIRVLAEKRKKQQDKPVADEGNAKWGALKDDEEGDERPLSEREVLADFQATTID